jgi:hypothetical protein
MKRTFPLLLLLVLSGCAQIDPYREEAISLASAASDRALVDAELIMCRGITVGAWMRAFGGDKARADAWKVLCSPKMENTP